MSAVKFFTHLFFPHESNNQRAKLLHSSSLTVIAIFFLGFQAILSFSSLRFPGVLGYAANINPSEVIRLTNDQRIQNGLPSLSENPTLSSAALAKGNDMLAKGYWAHFAPDGTSPWSFFLQFGYRYRYAGENLARDFSDAGSAVAAWMNSPSHRENILSANYREIGVAVLDGNLAGSDTTLIVQFFGTQLSGSPSIPIAEAATKTTAPAASPKATAVPKVTPTASPVPTTESAASTAGETKPLVSPFTTTRSISLATIGLLLLVLSIDLIIVRRKRIMRIGGRTLAHIAYLGMILAVILILKAGQII